MGQGQSGPQGPQGPPGGRGDVGPQGPPGTPGKDASGDPQQVASFLSSDGAFASKLAPMVAKDNAIGIAVAEKVANEQIPRQLVTNALLTNKAFSDKLIDSMAVDTRFRGKDGPPGSAFDELSIQSALQPKSMWCADGQMCRIPTSTPGTYLTGDTVIQRSKNLYLGGATLGTSGGLVVDTKHGVVVKDNNPVDGPFLYGAAGGNLGTFSQATSATTPSATLTWDANDIKVKNNLFVGGNLIQTAHDLKLGYKNFERGDSGESRALVKDNDNTLKINYMGDYAGGTTVDGKDLEISGGILKVGKWTIDGSGDDIKLFNKGNSNVATITNGGDLEINGHLRAPNGWLDLANKWRLRADGDWFNVDKDGVWKTAVHKDDSFEVRKNIKAGAWNITDNNNLTFKKDGQNHTPFQIDSDINKSNVWVGGDWRIWNTGNLEFDKFGKGTLLKVQSDGHTWSAWDGGRWWN